MIHSQTKPDNCTAVALQNGLEHLGITMPLEACEVACEYVPGKGGDYRHALRWLQLVPVVDVYAPVVRQWTPDLLRELVREWVVLVIFRKSPETGWAHAAALIDEKFTAIDGAEASGTRVWSFEELYYKDLREPMCLRIPRH